MSDQSCLGDLFRSIPILLGTCLLIGCQSTKPDGQSEDLAASARSASSQSEQMQIRVEGADATTSADGRTITLNYPITREKNDIIPDWVINPGIGGVLGAVGVAPKSLLGTREQLQEARLSARLELASSLEIRLQTVGREQLEAQLNAIGDGAQEDSRKSRLIIDRYIADMVLAGTRQRALWFDPENDECYVWMVLDGGVLQKVEHSTRQDLSLFLASVPIVTEYVPQRRQPIVPKVIVEESQQPAPQLPPPPSGPVEQLESRLKPIETIPIKPKETNAEGEK